MKAEDSKDRWLNAIFAGMMFDSVIIWAWVPAFFQLDPGEGYRNMTGTAAAFFIIPLTLIYAIVLAGRKTQYLKLKAIALILNSAPLFIIMLVVALLAAMGHMPNP